MPQRSIQHVIAGQQVVTASEEMTVTEAAQIMSKASIGAILVVDEGRLVGIFTERDALNRVLAKGLDPTVTSLAQVMTAKPMTVSPTLPLGHALHMMYDGGFRHVPVVDKGRPIGVVSARDALGDEQCNFERELLQREDINEIL
ncbi:CBS domain-containing protein [Denitromonas halophila]|uniref:CBS domain-containing protein n=1 Tax=Denitromonas halophila TaxID=1629404 RepID=A0A557QM55_9RHOO|nr:CBS domain-containing protein [Denitromonas halophila]TVO53979.1 CBS domain-containing protein [Denitromonas halophila]